MYQKGINDNPFLIQRYDKRELLQIDLVTFIIKLDKNKDSFYRKEAYQMANRMNEKGFTLVEVLISVAIVGIAFVAIMLSFSQSYKVTWQSEERAVANNFAKEQLEVLKRYDNSGVNLSIPSPYTRYYKDITYTVTTETVAGIGIFNSSNSTPVKVTVSWNSHGQDFSVVMESCYMKTY